jgi:hypothetical protein
MTYKQVKASVDKKIQKDKDKKAGVDRSKLAMEKAVEALDNSYILVAKPSKPSFSKYMIEKMMKKIKSIS